MFSSINKEDNKISVVMSKEEELLQIVVGKQDPNNNSI